MSDERRLKKILIVDDEGGFTEMLSLNLESTGRYETYIENNPLKAVDAAADFAPDLILMDVIMPGREGPDVVFELKNHETLSEVPIIFLTATVKKEEVKELRARIGGHLFVPKPSSMSFLLKSIESCLPE